MTNARDRLANVLSITPGPHGVDSLNSSIRSAAEAGRKALDRVLALHSDDGYGRCTHCVIGPSPVLGINLHADWPCATVAACGSSST